MNLLAPTFCRDQDAMNLSGTLKSCGQTSGNTAICTLFEGDYHFGLAAFVNSLVHAGYEGTVWAGYRGQLPPWLRQLKPVDEQQNEYWVAERVRLVFLKLETDIHLTNYKPQFMLELFADRARGSDHLWYFDPDICLCYRWSYFLNWQRHGIALCQEIVNLNLSETDPLRLQWKEIGTDLGLGEPRPLNFYANGGMVGLSATHVSFLHLWKRLLDHAGTTGCDLKQFQPGSREMPFFASDQDALNMAAMYTQHPLTVAGPEGMGFVAGRTAMYHTVGPKPWKGSLLMRAMAGLPPSPAIKFFFTQVTSPIRVYSPIRVRAKQLACQLAAFIGRFYRRR